MAMTSEEKERMQSLCNQMQIEQDQTKFMTLVHELNQLLLKVENRVSGKLPSHPATSG